MERILVVFDGSVSAEEALRWLCRVARYDRVGLLIVYFSSSSDLEGDSERKRAERGLDRAGAIAETAGLDYESEVLPPPLDSSTIIRAAVEHNCTAIYVPFHGFGEGGHSAIVQDLIENAPLPVLVYHFGRH